MKILITDDSHSILNLYQAALSRFSGLEVDFAESVDQARWLIANRSYDLVFMDHDLDQSHVSGLDLCGEIKEINPATKLVMVSARASDAKFRKNCYDLGVMRLIAKAASFLRDVPATVMELAS